jgi:hypothetical protein
MAMFNSKLLVYQSGCAILYQTSMRHSAWCVAGFDRSILGGYSGTKLRSYSEVFENHSFPMI